MTNVIRLARRPSSPQAKAIIAGIASAFPSQPWQAETMEAWESRVDEAVERDELAKADWFVGLRRLVDEHRGRPVVFADLLEAARAARRKRIDSRPEDSGGPKRIASRSQRNPLYPRVAFELVEAIRAGKVTEGAFREEFERRLRAAEEVPK